MQEQATWKAHSFTLVVFGGIVVLCSIFFVLGMIVGRGMGQRAAESATAATAKRTAEDRRLTDGKSVTAPYEAVETGKPTSSKAEPAPEQPPVSPLSDADPVKAAPKPSASSTASVPPAPKPPSPAPVKMIYLQVAALDKEAAAGKEVDKLRKNGFSAIIASGDGVDKFYHVQVGPFDNVVDAEAARKKLESLGYKTLRK